LSEQRIVRNFELGENWGWVSLKTIELDEKTHWDRQENRFELGHNLTNDNPG